MEGVPCVMLVPWGEATLPSPFPPTRVPLVWVLPARALLGAGRSSLLLVTTMTQGWAAQTRQEGGNLWASLSTQVSRRARSHPKLQHYCGYSVRPSSPR